MTLAVRAFAMEVGRTLTGEDFVKVPGQVAAERASRGRYAIEKSSERPSIRPPWADRLKYFLAVAAH